MRRISSRRPFSLTSGFWRPEIWVSTGLSEALAPAQLEVVVAHERAHARRRDSLRRLLAAVGSLPHLPPIRRALRDELALASEQACDEAAGREVGDRLAVAEAILAVERLLARAPQHPALSAFGGSAVEARLESLLAAEAAPPGGGGWFAAGVALFALALLALPLHHATEHALGLLLRLL